MKKNTFKLTTLSLLMCLLPIVIHSKDPVSTLLVKMLNDDYLTGCEIVFVNVKENRDNNVQNLNASDSETVLPYDVGSRRSSGTFSLVNSFTNQQQIKKFRRLDDIHRFGIKHCGVAILYIQKVTPDLSKRLFEMITPPYVPIIRKDEDLFLFVFKNKEEAHDMLLSHHFGAKIRFKIAMFSTNNGESGRPTIKTVHLYRNGGQPVIQTIELDTRVGVKKLFLDSTRNFYGKKVRVANPKAPSHFEMQPLPNGQGYRPLRGIYKAWLDVMMERFNFTVDLFLSSYFGGTGKRLKNGTWLGAVADVLYERAEMASFNGHIYNRHTVVEWSAPVTYEWMAFITHKPKSFFSAAAIFKPFPLILWAGFLVSVFMICLTMNVLLRLNCGIRYRMSYRSALLFLLASFLEQDAQCYFYVLHLPTIRAIVIFWLAFALILSTAYRGKLVSLIAFPALSWVPTNFEELAYSHYRVGLNTLGKGGAVYSVLSTSVNPVYQLLFNRLEIYPDSVQCLREALHHDFGCIMVKSIGDVVAYKNFTDKFGRSPFQESDQMALFHADGYIWEKKAVFRQNFDRLTWFIMETGLNGYWFHSDLDALKQKRLMWERETGNCTTIIDFGDGPSKLKLAHLKGLFFLFITGLSFGCICSIIEKFGHSQFYHRHHNLIIRLRNKIRNHFPVPTKEKTEI